jgi:hypothetical protein
MAANPIFEIKKTKQPIHDSAISLLAGFPHLDSSAKDDITLSIIQIYAQLGETLPEKFLPSPIPAQIPAGFGTLMTLPPEIRHNIYRLLIHSGHINILRVSQAINEEGSDFLFKDGVCRIAFGYKWRPPVMKPTRSLAKRIQTLSVNVYARYAYHFFNDHDFHRELDALRYFGSAAIHRKTCRVSFEVYPSTAEMVVREVLVILASFVGFEEVIVEMRLVGVSHISEYDFESLKKEPPPVPFWFDSQPENVIWRMANGAELAQKVLAPTLGPARPYWIEKSFKEVVLKQAYYPRKHADAIAEGIAG